MGPMLPRMGEWAGHLHGHEGSFVGREKRSLSPTLRNLHAKSDRHRTMLERSFVLRGSHTLKFKAQVLACNFPARHY